MGDSDEEDAEAPALSEVEKAKLVLAQMHAELDLGFKNMALSGGSSFFNTLTSTSVSSSSALYQQIESTDSTNNRNTMAPHRLAPSARQQKSPFRHSAPSALRFGCTPPLEPNYKLLYQTHVRLNNRVRKSAYRLSALQTRGGPPNAHTNTIYCLQLYTYPSGLQVLFTGSRDRSIREWNLNTGLVERVITGVHESSVLSLCVYKGFVASAGSDRRVAVWDLTRDRLVKVICDHEDSVLCVRFDDERLVSCSKDRTVRTYSFPHLEPQFILCAHRAAVNAVSISKNLIVSGSGDRSIRLWDSKTGQLLHTFENHHSRGIASIDFRPPFVLSGSSDRHLRFFDITTSQGWSTSPETDYEEPAGADASLPFLFMPMPTNPPNIASSNTHICQTCGSANAFNSPSLPVLPGQEDLTAIQQGGHFNSLRCMHADLVRSVALGDDFVVTGSYDLTIKVWDRKTGALVADLNHGHTGRIFCVSFDYTKIVSCGEDQRICVWDFSHGINTSFIQL